MSEKYPPEEGGKRGADDIEQVTSGKGNNQLLYFTSSSLLEGNRELIYIGDGDGEVNLYYLHMQTGETRQLTHQKEGILRSYVYFDGQPFKGFGKASVSLNEKTGNIYYIQGRQVMQVNAHTGESRRLCLLPEGEVTGFTHVDREDRYLCIPTIDQCAFDVEGNLHTAIDACVQEKGLCSWLRVYRTDTGEQVLCEPVNRGWVTHVQFSPKDAGKILYNHEWALHSGIRRMWLWDGKKHIRLRPEGEGRSREDWVCHEMWEQDGEHLIYHGGRPDGRSFIGRAAADGSSPAEIPLPDGYRAYGHFTVNESGSLLVTDGYYEAPDGSDSGSNGRWIAIVRPDWEKGEVQWFPLCRHGSSWDCQCSHPHPIFDHSGSCVYFTSDVSGSRQIYRTAARV